MKQCKWCNKKMKNAHPNRKFCCTKHKDRYWNTVNPRGMFAHLSAVEHTIDPDDDSGDACYNSDFGDQ